MNKTKLDSASEQNILNMLMESSIISSDQMSKINSTSTEIGKSKLETAFELNFADENKILKDFVNKLLFGYCRFKKQSNRS